MLVHNQLLLLLSLFALGVVGQGLARSRDTVDSVNWNFVTDNLIDQFKEQILKQGEDEVPLPDLHESLERKFGRVFKGTLLFTAMDGHLSSISSIHRIADVMMSESGNLTFTALLKFGNLKIRYGHYTARVAGVGPSGTLSARVMDNSVLLRVRIDVGRNGCSLVHEDVEEVTLGGIMIKVTGLGPLNYLASKLATLIGKGLRHDITAGLEQLLDKQLTYILRNTEIDCTS